MNQLKQIFESIRLQEAKSATVNFWAGLAGDTIGFASYDEDRQILIIRVRRCQLLDGDDYKDILPAGFGSTDVDEKWVKKNLGFTPRYKDECIVGSNDTYPLGYILFVEQNPSHRSEMKLTKSDWELLLSAQEASFSDQMPNNEQAQVWDEIRRFILTDPQTQGWVAPMEDLK